MIIKKSTIVYSNAITTLEPKINKLLAEGWELYGNIFLDNDDDMCIIMTKLVDTEDSDETSN